MDLGRAADTIRRAGSLNITLPAGNTLFRDLTAADMAWLATSRHRSGNVAVAKKALQAYEALEKLSTALDDAGLPNTRPGTAATVPTAMPATHLAMVPYVRTMPPPPPARTALPITLAPPHYLMGWVAAYRPYRWIFFLAWKLIFWLPIVVSVCLTAYLVFAIAYVALNPRCVITFMFQMIDIPPTYAQYVVASLLDQAKIELAARFR